MFLDLIPWPICSSDIGSPLRVDGWTVLGYGYDILIVATVADEEDFAIADSLFWEAIGWVRGYSLADAPFSAVEDGEKTADGEWTSSAYADERAVRFWEKEVAESFEFLLFAPVDEGFWVGKNFFHVDDFFDFDSKIR